MTFPLYRRPTSVVLLDDDVRFLDLVGVVLPPHWAIKLFSEPQTLLNYLENDTKIHEEENWVHREIVGAAREGQSAMQAILQYWKDKGISRYSLSSVCVLDYSMPQMTGVEVLEKIQHWNGFRILLTGQADEMLAIRTFNQGLIQQFIPKQSRDMAKRLIEAINKLMNETAGQLDKIWLGSLTKDQHNLLQKPHITEKLLELIQQYQWTEYVVIGAPFGILGLNRDGQASWLQIESQQGLRSWDDLLEVAQSEGLPEPQLQALATGECMIDLELRFALGDDSPSQVSPIIMLCPNEGVTAAVFNIKDEYSPGLQNSWSYYLTTLPKRKA